MTDFGKHTKFALGQELPHESKHSNQLQGENQLEASWDDRGCLSPRTGIKLCLWKENTKNRPFDSVPAVHRPPDI